MNTDKPTNTETPDHAEPAPPFQFPAMLMAHTPSGPVPVCEMHGRKLNALARFMGYHVGFSPLEAFQECSNCVNEHRAKLSAENAKNAENR